MLSKKALESFKKIYFQEFNVTLSDTDANEKAMNLLQFISLIYKPIPTEDSFAISTSTKKDVK